MPGDLLLLTMVTSVGVMLLVPGKLLRIRELDQQIVRLWTLAPWSRAKTLA